MCSATPRGGQKIKTFDALITWLEKYDVRARLDVGDYDELAAHHLGQYELTLKRAKKNDGITHTTAVLRSGRVANKEDLITWAVTVCKATWPDMAKGSRENKRKDTSDD